MQISPILWLAAAVGFLALEASTFNMTSIWFAIGSAAALLCCVFTGSFRVQADGVDWNARCATPGDTLDPGALCRVTEIHSTLLIVEPVLTESRNPHTTT